MAMLVYRRVPSGKLTVRWLENGGPGLSRCMNPIENGDFPASYVSLPECRHILPNGGFLMEIYHEIESVKKHAGRWRSIFQDLNMQGKSSS